MKLFIHVGMGKTGSTAIQRTFRASGAVLAPQRAAYLGGGFDPVGSRFTCLMTDIDFLKLEGPELRAAADRFSAALEAKQHASGSEIFLFSNEALWGLPANLTSFADALSPEIEVRLIGYMRRPVDWLPSAYAQWGVAHKRYPGPIRSYDEMSPTLLQQFGKSIAFADLLGNRFEAYDYGAAGDVVLHLAGRMGLTLAPERSRYYERRSPGELALRALFNDTVPNVATPALFERATLRKIDEVPSLGDLARIIFDYSATEGLLRKEAGLFDEIRARFGFDLLAGGLQAREVVTDLDDLRREILDYLMTITLTSAKRIQQLETRLEALEGGKPAPSGEATAPRRRGPGGKRVGTRGKKE